jgi:hypothetical protein
VNGCTFYHEGGVGERRWVVGWRYGIIRSAPAKGAKKGWTHIEIPVPCFTFDLTTKRWNRRPNARVWVHSKNVNAVGDYRYHGNEGLAEEVADRAAVKEKQTKAAKKKKSPPK